MMSRKIIWIINQYASLPSTGTGGRHRHLSRELAALGYKITLICARWTHGVRDDGAAERAPELEEFEGFQFLRIPTGKYKHAHDKKRILNWFFFAWKMKSLRKKLDETPDVIIYSSPSLIGYLSAYMLAKKYNAKLAFEVRDIWPLTLIQLGGYKPSHPFIRFMQWIEDKAYRDSHVVVSNLKNSVDHMVQRGLVKDKFVWIPNGFSLYEVGQKISLNVNVESQLPKDKFIVGYTGTIGLANALQNLVEAAELLKEHSDIAFVLVGHGKEKEKLQQLIEDKGLDNVQFIDPIPKSEVQGILSNFDVCYIGLTRDPLFKFGVSPNKLFDYFYSGKPIIYAIDSGEYKPVLEANAGLHIPPQDSKALSQAVLQLYKMSPAERMQMGENGRNIALEEYEYGQLAERLAGVLFEND